MIPFLLGIAHFHLQVATQFLTYISGYRLHLCLPKIHPLKQIPSEIVLGDRAFGRCLGHEVEFWKWDKCHLKERPQTETPCIFHNVRTQWQRALTWPYWHPDLRLPASRAVRKTFPLFISNPTYSILLEQPNWPKTLSFWGEKHFLEITGYISTQVNIASESQILTAEAKISIGTM